MVGITSTLKYREMGHGVAIGFGNLLSCGNCLLDDWRQAFKIENT
jgi:hypothetical protein